MAEWISADTVNETWQRMAETPEAEIPFMIDEFTGEQPAVLAYLLAADPDVFNEEEREAVFYIGLVTWQIMKQSRRQLQAVSEERLFQIEDENYEFLDILSSDTEADFLSATLDMIENHPEPEVLRYLIEAVMEDDEPDDPGFRDDVKGMAFIYLKIALEALIQSLD